MTDYISTKEQRLAAAQDALQAIRNGWYMTDHGKVYFPDADYRKCEYVKKEEVARNRSILGTPEYTLAAMDSFEALELAEDPSRAAVLNFACATTPGGGFLSGSKAQEECLCRMSTLYGSLTSPEAGSYYANNRKSTEAPLPVTFLYSPDVFVFRNPDLSCKDVPVKTQVITAAAPDLKHADRGVARIDLYNYFTDAMRTMFAFLNGRADTLILGAWGCGAFGNSPEMVARCFRTVLEDEGYGRMFRHIIFAVRNPETKNFQSFRRTFKDRAKIAGVELKPRRRVSKKVESMEKEFTKGSTAYVVQKVKTKKGEQPQWTQHEVTIQSAGKKYVTTTGGGPKRKFLTSKRPVLRTEKGGAFLVPESDQAKQMIKMMEDSVKKGGHSAGS